MDINIDAYKSHFDGGLRQHLFLVYINFPTGDQRNAAYHVKSTDLPASDFEQSLSYYMGQEYKMPGRQSFQDWTVTFHMDKKASVLKDFIEWRKMIHDPVSNKHGDSSKYMKDCTVELLDYETGKAKCKYKLYYAWPIEVGSVSLDYSSNELATFEVTFNYQYYTVEFV